MTQGPTDSAVVVLAAGAGTRMRSDTNKVLHPLAGRSMLSHALHAVAKTAPQHLVVVVGKDRDQVVPAVAELADSGRERFLEIVSANPASSLGWALLAEGSLRIDSPEGDVGAYAYARTGYHRGLDALRRAGWRGTGPIPWEHVPNRGFLRCLALLATSARAIGETDEWDRCSAFLEDSSHTAYVELLG